MLAAQTYNLVYVWEEKLSLFWIQQFTLNVVKLNQIYMNEMCQEFRNRGYPVSIIQQEFRSLCQRQEYDCTYREKLR